MLEKEAKESYWDSDASGALSSKENYVIGFKDGYNKANEWHKYSERPKEKINALCFDISQNKFILGFYDIEADEWIRYGGYETIYIDLWKKIEVPK